MPVSLQKVICFIRFVQAVTVHKIVWIEKSLYKCFFFFKQEFVGFNEIAVPGGNE